MRKNKIKKTAALCFLLIFISAGVLAISSCDYGTRASGEETVTLKWCTPGRNLRDSEMVMEEFNKILYEKTGLRLEMQFIDDNIYAEKMNMNISSDADFDLWFVGYLNKYDKMVQNESLYDITDMLEKSELKEAMPQYVWDSVTIGNSIYAVPNMQVMFEQRCLRIKKDLAQKYNLDLKSIKKTEDIEPFLSEIRDNETDIYPFRINMHEWSFQSVDNDDFYDITNFCGLWVDGEGILHCEPYYEIPDYRNRIYKLYEWFEKGYIRKDAASVISDTKDYQNGRYAVAADHYKPGGDYEFRRHYDYETETVVISQPYIGINSPSSTMIGINKRSKHPEEAFKLIELINSDKELYNMLVYGIEGVHYNKIGENRITFIAGQDYGLNAWAVGNQFNAYFIDGQSEDDWEKTIKMNEETPKSDFMGFYVDTSNIRTEIIQLGNIEEKYNVMLTGAENPDTYWEDFKKEMEQAGMEKVCNEVKKQAQDFLNSKKN